MATPTNSLVRLKKKDIIKNVFLNVGISSSYSAKIINDLIYILITNLCIDGKIKIKNFGSFKVQSKNKRLGRNPKNKKEYDISARIIATFKAAEGLKLKINQNEKKNR
jgi:nucleoid DNA-binding protein